MLLCQIESVIEVAKADHNLDNLVILPVVQQEVYRLLEHFGIITVADTARDIVDHVA